MLVYLLSLEINNTIFQLEFFFFKSELATSYFFVQYKGKNINEASLSQDFHSSSYQEILFLEGYWINLELGVLN